MGPPLFTGSRHGERGKAQRLMAAAGQANSCGDLPLLVAKLLIFTSVPQNRRLVPKCPRGTWGRTARMATTTLFFKILDSLHAALAGLATALEEVRLVKPHLAKRASYPVRSPETAQAPAGSATRPVSTRG